MGLRITSCFLALIALSAVDQEMVGQTPTDQDCLGAIPICEDIYVQDNAYSGEGNYPSELGLGLGCNFQETNSVWYTFTIQEDGLFSFILTPVEESDDYDWALFNLTDASCADIATDASLEVSCNSYGEFGNNGPTGISSANGGTGNSNGPGNTNGPPFNADLPVSAGEVYALVVMDWSGTPTGYTLDLTNTTASIYDDQGPQIASAEMHCDNTIDVIFNENVVCSSLDNVSWELVDQSGTALTASSYESECTSDEGLIVGITLVFDENIVPEDGLEAYTLNIINDIGNVFDACGNEVELEDLDFEFSSVPIEAIPQVIDADCDADNGQVDASTVLNATAPITYDLSGISQATPIFNGLAPGMYTLTVTDSDFCTDQVDITVGQPDPPVITSLTSTPVTCGFGCTGTISIGSNTALTYSIDGGINSSPDGEFLDVCEGEYNVVVSSGNNCEATASIQVGVTSPLDAEMRVDPLQASIFDPVFDLYNLTEGAAEVEWFIGHPSNYYTMEGDTLSYRFDNPIPGYYDVMLQITDSAGCMSETQLQIRLLAEFVAYIPNSFSPNGDGINDTFLPVLDGFVRDKYRLTIYDRWGNVVFETDDPQQAWLGEVADGEYYPSVQTFHYVLSAQPISASGKELRRGTITMIR
ncbi:MAG: T9SS type B sorting domain-containing protein [Flavobacteriales bacterium]|nr:T9SS type B sorting domain-containing protein [Flavobacteriales bacterium]